MIPKRQGLSLLWKVAGTFLGLIGFLGLVVLLILHYFIGRTLQEQIDQRASVITATLSQAVSGHALKKNILELYGLTTKYARLEGVAYVFIQNANKEIIVHSFGTSPLQSWQPLTPDDREQGNRRILTVQGKTVHEIRMPILEGRVGTVHVGFWEEIMRKEIYRSLLPIIKSIALVFLAGAIISAYLAWRIVLPIQRLTDIAGRISMGHLETPVIVSRGDIGHLARSLERIRSSLKAAMASHGQS